MLGGGGVAGLTGTLRWTHRNSNSKVNSNQDDVRSALALGYVLLRLFCSLRYTLGPALFVGWIGGAILVIGGAAMCLACRGLAPDKKQRYAPSPREAIANL